MPLEFNKDDEALCRETLLQEGRLYDIRIMSDFECDFLYCGLNPQSTAEDVETFLKENCIQYETEKAYYGSNGPEFSVSFGFVSNRNRDSEPVSDGMLKSIGLAKSIYSEQK